MTISWITIRVADFEQSKEFYRDYLGMKARQEFSPNEFMSIAFFEAENGMQVELICDKNSAAGETNTVGVSLGISASNYSELLQEARERKILTVEPAVLGGHMECFFVDDPNGFGIQIVKDK